MPHRPTAVVRPNDWLFGWAAAAARIRQRFGGPDRATADIERLRAVARRQPGLTTKERAQALLTAFTVHGSVALAATVTTAVLMVASSFVLTLPLAGLGALCTGLAVSSGVLSIAAYQIQPTWLEHPPWRRNMVVVLAALAGLALAALIFLIRLAGVLTA